ncbi:MAG: amidohydrolase family protein [Mycoplasmoidaceae bacterium]|nr:amidohydrolase family protein [Mycoplasmoidaceae bacterium]
MSKNDIIKALKAIANKKHLDNEAKIIGVNLEGPFISKEKKGAQDENFILSPNSSLFATFNKAAKNKIKITTIQIENCPVNFIKYLKKNNIVASVGHSMANGIDLIKAHKAGLSCVTHTYNAMQKVVDKNIGIIGQLLLHKDMYAELILDLKHVSKQQALVLKNHKNLILITDSNEAKYMPDGKYHLGNNEIYVKNGISTTKTGQLSGSVLTIPQALKNARKVFNYSFTRCIDLVCKHPANNLKLKNCGIIKNGNPADFVIIDKNFNIYQTYINGKLVYSKK